MTMLENGKILEEQRNKFECQSSTTCLPGEHVLAGLGEARVTLHPGLRVHCEQLPGLGGQRLGKLNFLSCVCLKEER